MARIAPRFARRERGAQGLLRRAVGRFASDTVWHNWKWDAVAGICSGIYQGCVWTFALQLARGEMRANGLQMAWATAAPAIGYLFALLWARQMEGRSKLPFVTVTWTLSRGMFLLTPLLVRGPYATELFILLLCAPPILFSVSTPAYTAIMKDIYPDAQRGRMMSYVRVGMAAAMLLTARVMGQWQEHGGLDFRWMFALGGAFGVGTALAFSRLKLPPVLHAGTPPPVGEFLKDSILILKRDRGFRWFQTSVVITGFGNLIANTLYPIYQVDVFRITPTQIATIVLETQVASLVSLFFWGWYMDRHGSLAAVLLAVFLNCMTPLLYALSPTLTWIYLAALFTGFSQSGIDLGYLNTTLTFSERGKAAQYQAVHSTVFGLRGTIAPLVAIPLFFALGKDFRATFLFSLGIMGTGLIFQAFSMRSFRKEQVARARADK